MTVVNHKQRIESLKDGLNRAKNAKLVAETNKQNAEQQLEQIKEQMAAEGVHPSDIQQAIQQLDVQMETDIQRVESLMPQV